MWELENIVIYFLIKTYNWNYKKQCFSPKVAQIIAKIKKPIGRGAGL